MLISQTLKKIILIAPLVILISCGGSNNDEPLDNTTNQVSTTNNEPSTTNNEPSTTDNEPSTTDKPSTTDNEPSTTDNEPSTTDNEPNEKFNKISLKSKINNVQPMTGIVFWSDNDDALNALGETVQLEYSYMLYSDIVEENGVYNWQAVDQLLDAIASRKHQAILRFRYTYPGETEVTVPAYIANAPGYNMTRSQVEGQNTFLPDWSFEELEVFTLAFFQAFSERYDGDPRLAFLQVGFGSYGEYHLYDGPFSIGNNFPSKRFQTEFFTVMNDSFKTTPWSVSIDAADSNYSPFAADPSLTSLPFGLFDDSFMHQNHSDNDSEYNRASWLLFGDNRFAFSPAGGEFNYYSSYDQQNVLTLPNGPHGRSFESFAKQYHISYMIGNDQYQYQSADRIRQAAKAIGYQFTIEKFESSDTQTRVTIGNKGIAPIYYDAYPTIDGIRSTDSLKGLLPGESLEFLINKGGNSPELSIECDCLVEGQTIEFAADL